MRPSICFALHSRLMASWNMGLVKVTIEADAVTMGLLPAITFEPVHGGKLEYIGDDFHEGLMLLRHYIEKGSKEVVKRGQAQKP